MKITRSYIFIRKKIEEMNCKNEETTTTKTRRSSCCFVLFLCSLQQKKKKCDVEAIQCVRETTKTTDTRMQRNLVCNGIAIFLCLRGGKMKMCLSSLHLQRIHIRFMFLLHCFALLLLLHLYVVLISSSYFSFFLLLLLKVIEKLINQQHEHRNKKKKMCSDGLRYFLTDQKSISLWTHSHATCHPPKNRPLTPKIETLFGDTWSILRNSPVLFVQDSIFLV